MSSHKGLSTVVGMVFAIIALTSTVAYISYSMNILNNFGQSVLQQTQQTLNVDKEKFQITSVTTPGNKFNITVTNTGNLPITFTKLWVQNTTTIDWVHSYVPSNPIVNPGGTVTNIGQSIPLYYKPTASYNVNLVTSRGNSQTFTVNSVSATPLIVQLIAFPPSVDVGYQSELVMVVTNNSSSTLVNVSPNTPTQTNGLAQCSLSQASPASYSTLSPGSTAIFKWDLTVVQGTNGQYCTYTATPALQNGYSQSVSATVNVDIIKFSQTNLAANTGIMTIDYTSFRFTQGSGSCSNMWCSGWNFTSSVNTAFRINMTNNNSTTDFYVSSYSQIYYARTGASNSGPIYIVGSVTPGNPYTMTPFCGGMSDWCIKIPAGQTVTLYFGSYGKTGREGTSSGSLGQSDTYMTTLMLYGRFGTSDSPATRYAQSLPYIAWLGA